MKSEFIALLSIYKLEATSDRAFSDNIALCVSIAILCQICLSEHDRKVDCITKRLCHYLECVRVCSHDGFQC